MGFDEWMSLYNHFYVIGAKCTVTVMTESTSLPNALLTCGLRLSADTDALSGGLEHFMELPKTRWRYIGAGTGSRAMTTLSKKFSYKKFFTQSPIDDSNKGSDAGDPSEAAYFAVSLGTSSTGATGTQTVTYHVKIEYLAVFAERKTLGQS